MKLAEECREASIRGLQSAGLRLLQHITTGVLPTIKDERTGHGPPIDRGVYRASWRARKVLTGVVVESTLPYASIIEWGAKAENIVIGREMIAELTDWVIRKGLVKNAPKGDKVARYQEARSIAWAIAVSMKRCGIFNGGQGLRVLEKASEKIGEFVHEEVDRELKRVG